MILFTNGCSWTYGGSLNLDQPEQTIKRLQSVWPHHLGKLLGAEQTVNLAVGCGSNQRIFRTTYDWIVSQSEETLKNTIAVIQFTEPSRYEVNVPVNNIELNDAWLKCKFGVVTSDIERKDINEWLYETNERRISLFSNIEGIYSTLSYCESLHNLFTKHGIKYYFWDAGFLFFLLEEHLMDETTRDYFLKNFNWLPYRISYTGVSSKDPHPSFQGHQEIAEKMYQTLAKINLANS